VQGIQQHEYTAEEKHKFEKTPGALNKYRKELESGLNGTFSIYIANTQLQRETEVYMRQAMSEKLANKELEAKLIPSWKVGCRRPTPGVGYLESLTKPNVQVVYGEIKEITGAGCLCDDGNEYAVDVLICATGFDTTFRPRFPVVNPAGKDLRDVWDSAPESYLGLAAAEFPNYLIFLGPNCPIGNGPVLSAIGKSNDLSD
jgi:cation diffusion facilitator CzcD-associated flavoprotein CzcO